MIPEINHWKFYLIGSFKNLYFTSEIIYLVRVWTYDSNKWMIINQSITLLSSYYSYLIQSNACLRQSLLFINCTMQLTLPQQHLCESSQVPDIGQSVPTKRKKSWAHPQFTRSKLNMHVWHHIELTWCLTYTTGRVNIETTAGMKNRYSIKIESCM